MNLHINETKSISDRDVFGSQALMQTLTNKVIATVKEESELLTHSEVMRVLFAIALNYGITHFGLKSTAKFISASIKHVAKTRLAQGKRLDSF